MDVSHDKTEIQMRRNQIQQPLLTYLLTPWSRDLPEKLTGPQLLRKFLAFYGTRRFITAFTRACHVFVSSARLYQSMPHPTTLRPILILSSHLHLGLSCGRLPSGFPTKTLYAPLLATIRATCPTHLSSFDHPIDIGWAASITLLVM